MTENMTHAPCTRRMSLMTTLLLAILISCTAFLTDSVFADDAENSRQGASFISSTLMLDLPEVTVEGSSELYSARLQLKQQGNNIFFEVVDVGPSQYQEASMAAAVLSANGTLHIPFVQLEDQSLWNVDLNWIPPSLQPITFLINMDTLARIPFEKPEDDLLGASKKTCITICTPWGCFSICTSTTTTGDSKPKPFDY